MPTRYPIADLAQFMSDVNNLFSSSTQAGRFSWAVQPLVDLYESGDELVLTALVPGVSPENLDVSIEQNVLTIAGRYPQFVSPDQARQLTWYRKEIPSGQFTEQISLPVPVATGQVQAHFENGTLTLRMPKAEYARAKKIQVQSASGTSGTQALSQGAPAGSNHSQH